MDDVEISLNSDKYVKEIAEDLSINYGNFNRWRIEYRKKKKLKSSTRQSSTRMYIEKKPIRAFMKSKKI